MKNNKTLAKIAEIFFASGIPILALADKSANSKEFFSSLPILMTIIMAGGWHVKTFNDNCEDGKIFSAESFIPLLLLPIIVYLRPMAGMILIFIFLNWDIYSMKGKNNVLISIIANFLGGFLHFTLGVMCVKNGMHELINSKAVFFALAMLSGSMHHDAYHAEDDKKKSFITGAVKFGAAYWWKLAIFPMLFSIFFLIQSEKEFFQPFLLFGLIPYFTCYLIISAILDSPQKFHAFRIICRLTFAFAALIFIANKLQFL